MYLDSQVVMGLIFGAALGIVGSTAIPDRKPSPDWSAIHAV